MVNISTNVKVSNNYMYLSTQVNEYQKDHSIGDDGNLGPGLGSDTKL